MSDGGMEYGNLEARQDPTAGFSSAVRQAKAEAWRECVAWFAIQGPLKDAPRIPGWVLSLAEQENPYDDLYEPFTEEDP